MVEPQSNGESFQEVDTSNVETLAPGQVGAESTDDSRPQQVSSRAEEALDDLLQRASGWTQWLSLHGLVWYSRAREELEDIVAEAQQIRHAPNLNPFSPAAIYSRGREELARIVVEA